MISALQSKAITDAERALGRFTRHKLKMLDTWSQWHDAKQTQLDQLHHLGMYPPPHFPPPGAIILNPH
jgi:hypothetical protein